MSKIEWTEQTWNPIAGCSIVSKGCTNCYAMKMAARIEAMGTAPHYAGLTQPSKGGAVWTGKIALAPEATLLAPLRRKKPTMYFVNSMSDLFHEAVPDEWIDRIFAVMALCPQHTFQVLTKRPERMQHYVRFLCNRDDLVAAAALEIAPPPMAEVESWRTEIMRKVRLPLPNVWLGTSVEDQERANERIPALLATPAAARFVSAEPLLGRLNIAWALSRNRLDIAAGFLKRGIFSPGLETLRRLDWVIVGGESGPGARPMHPDWARSLRDQCAAAGVAFFFKQWGEFVSVSEVEGPGAHHRFPDGATVRRTGKKLAGRRLDGVLHDAMPVKP